jgi:hypothetical protein
LLRQRTAPFHVRPDLARSPGVASARGAPAGTAPMAGSARLQHPTRPSFRRSPPGAASDYWSEPPTRRAISCDCAHWSAKFFAAAPLQVIFQKDWSCWTASFFFGGFSSA